jgi:hypothetical protein
LHAMKARHIPDQRRRCPWPGSSLRDSELMAQHQDLGVLHHASRRDNLSSGTIRETIRKVSFKPTSHRPSRLRTDQDLPAQRPNAGPSRPRSAEHPPR